jgi:HlyD family secretion protein
MNTHHQTIRKHNIALVFVAIIVFLIIIASLGWIFLRPKTTVIQGQVEATTVRISSKVPGHIVSIRVKEGDIVCKGDTLAIIDSPEIQAKLRQAKAAEAAAQAQDDKANSGTRGEQREAAKAVWQQALAGKTIAEKSWRRVKNLFDKGVVSAQKCDEAEATYKAASATESAARAQYLMAENGARKEDKEAAGALVEQAQGAVNEAEAYLDETCLLSPIDGEISEIYPHEGELIGTGMPIMYVMNRQDAWVVFNLREDQLKELTIGTDFDAYLPAMDTTVNLSVYYMKDMGTYASWKATKALGQYDLRSFEVKARPQQPISGWYPGMSAVIFSE